MKKIDPKAKKSYDMIVAYLKAGGDPTLPFIRKFCEEFDIKHEEFTKIMASPESDTMEDKLRRLGLI